MEPKNVAPLIGGALLFDQLLPPLLEALPITLGWNPVFALLGAAAARILIQYKETKD